MLRSRLTSLLTAAAAVLSVTATGLVLGAPPVAALTPVQVIDTFGAAPPPGATRVITESGGTVTHSGGASTVTITNRTDSSSQVTVEYAFASATALNAQGATALVLDHSLTSSDTTGMSGVSWGVSATDTRGRVSTTGGNARPGQPMSVMPLAPADGIGFQGSADMSSIVRLRFEFFPITNTGGHVNALVLDQLYTRDDSVPPQSQTVSFTSGAPASAAVGQFHTVAATASSGLPVTFSVGADTTNNACTLIGSTIAFQHVGTCVVAANQAGNAAWSAAPTVTSTFLVARGRDTAIVTKGWPTNPVVGTTSTPWGVANPSGRPMELSVHPATSNNSCVVEGTTVRYQHVGTCIVSFSVASSDDWEGATTSHTATVTQGSQTWVGLPSAPHTTVGVTWPVPPITESGTGRLGTVTVAADQTACTLANSVVSFARTGTCTLEVRGNGNADWSAPNRATITLTAGPGTPSLAVTQGLSDGRVGDTTTLAARASAGEGAVTFATTTPQVCSLDGAVVSYRHPGTCSVTVALEASTDWTAASTILTAQVTKGSQGTVVASGLSDAPLGSRFTPAAHGTQTSTGATLSLDPATTHNACRVDGDTVTYQHAGLCVVQASAHGDADWNSGTVTELRAEVTRAPQTITFTSPAPAAPVYPTTTFRPSTDGGGASGQPVSLDTVDPAACSIAEGTLTFHRAGTCTVRATQAGTDDYLPAAASLLPVEVATIPSSLTVGVTPASTVISVPSTLTATVTPAVGQAAGRVQFRVDGVEAGDPVRLVAGVATAPATPLPAVGAHQVSATFLPDRTDVHTPGQTGTSSWTVQPAATTTQVSVSGSRITATVAVAAPARVALSGTVTFRVDGTVVGTRAVGPTGATLTHRVPTGKASTVSASYSGDASLLPSSGSTARRDPAVRATLTSSRAQSRGWYTHPVTVTFACRSNGAALTTACPKPVTLTASGAAQRVTRTLQATDGGMATVTAGPINIDRLKPTVALTGVPRTVTGATPAVQCHARDTLSGISGCTVKVTRSTTRVTWTATARDKAGNTRTVRRSARVVNAASFTLSGVPSVHGVAQVRAGRSYTMVVVSPTRPQYVNAAVDPRQPSGRTAHFVRAGSVRGVPRWVLGVTFSPGTAGRTWQIGAQTGAKVLTLRVRVL